MSGAALLLVFIFGSIVGSFLNVLTLRYNTGRPITTGRSKCLVCGHELSSIELIPILSFILQHGQCQKCGTKISWQYPAVEFFTGLAFLAIFYKEWPSFADGFSAPSVLTVGYLLAAISLLIAITAYDLRHKIIPDGMVWTFVALSFAQMFIGGIPPTSDLLAGPLLALPFATIWLLSGGRAMGLGDGKLALGIGWMLGLTEGISALIVSFWAGGLVSIYLLLLFRGKFTMKSEVPFAPFLVLGTFISFFFNLDLTGIAGFFQ